MTPTMNRRTFLTAAAGMVVGSPPGAWAQRPFRHRLYKAVIVGKPTEESLRQIKEAGFDGVEAGIVSPEEAKQAAQIARRVGVRIHSVLRGWAQFNSDNPDEVEQGFQETVAAIKAAGAYGADAVLLVPGRIGGMPMPEPWEFKVRFDPSNSHLIRVVEGDNQPYQAYIEAHNQACDAFRKHVRRLVPYALQNHVFIAIENVWNNLFVDPRHMAHFVDSIRSGWVRVYFDLANHVKYSPTEQWIAILRRRIVKCHVKDFRLNPDGHGGQFVDIRDGSVNWPAVRRALDDVGYQGWLTIEGSDELSLQERSRRLDLILAGK